MTKKQSGNEMDSGCFYHRARDMYGKAKRSVLGASGALRLREITDDDVPYGPGDKKHLMSQDVTC